MTMPRHVARARISAAPQRPDITLAWPFVEIKLNTTSMRCTGSASKPEESPSPDSSATSHGTAAREAEHL